MFVFVWITFAGFFHSGSGLSHHARHERTRYVSSRNQIYGGTNFDYHQNYIPFVHYWERPLQVLETSMNVPKKLSSRPLFSWDIPVPISTYTPLNKMSTVGVTERLASHDNDVNDSPFDPKSLQISRSDQSKASLAVDGLVKKKKSVNKKKSIEEKELKGQNSTTNKRESRKLRRKKKGKKDRKGKTSKRGKGLLNDQVNEINPKISVYLEKSGNLLREDIKMKSPCEAMEDKCEHRCEDVDGRAVCTCFRGFTPVGTKCIDINECETNNGGCNGRCFNTLGSRKCICYPGFRSVDGTCADINECLLRNGHGPCQDQCMNTPGSYFCGCGGLPGTTLSADKHTCENTRECDKSSSGCSHDCVSISGTAFCTCPDGMELGDDWKTCHDIDECSNPDDYNVECAFDCINTIGSYTCTSGIASREDDSSP